MALEQEDRKVAKKRAQKDRDRFVGTANGIVLPPGSGAGELVDAVNRMVVSSDSLFGFVVVRWFLLFA